MSNLPRLSGPQVFEDVVLTVVFLHVRTRKEKDWGGVKERMCGREIKILDPHPGVTLQTRGDKTDILSG